MCKLTGLPNIGKKLEEQLISIGIETPEQLKAAGSKGAWLKIKAVDSSACYNRLCALEGAIQSIHWHNLSPEAKQDLKEFYRKNK